MHSERHEYYNVNYVKFESLLNKSDRFKYAINALFL